MKNKKKKATICDIYKVLEEKGNKSFYYQGISVIMKNNESNHDGFDALNKEHISVYNSFDNILSNDKVAIIRETEESLIDKFDYAIRFTDKITFLKMIKLLKRFESSYDKDNLIEEEAFIEYIRLNTLKKVVK